MKKKLFILLPLLTLTLTACDGFNYFFPSGGFDPSPTSRELETSFINTFDNKVNYVALNKSTLTALPETTFNFKLDVYEEGETPSFAGEWENLTWGSEDPNIASIDENGLMTANNVGTTRIYGKIFSYTGAYCTVNVIKKELDSIEIINPRKTYILGSEFTPSFTCTATYKGGVKETITPTSIDYSSVNTSIEGKYTVNVSYTFEEITKTASYEVSVIDNPTYEAKSLSYTVNDLYQNRSYGWYNPSSGTIKGLVIPVYFTDTNSFFTELEAETEEEITKEKVRADLDTAFFGEGREDGWNSVSSYYQYVSSGKVNLTGTISEWYEPGYSSVSVNNENKIEDLVRDAVEWYFTTHPEEDMKTYDSDNNGVFDYLNIIYGRRDYDEKKDDSSMALYWGKISASSTPVVPSKDGNPKVNFYMWASYEELYANVDNTPVDAHVFTHETGHTFGLEDLYDYGDTDYRPIAGSTMMFHNTHQQDPFCTLSLGWSQVIVPETSCVIELGDYQTSKQTILLSANPESVDSPFDEYILVELYAPNGVNKYDTTHKWQGFYSLGAENPGIRLWHVNATLAEELSKDNYDFTTNPLTGKWSRYAFSNSWNEGRGSILGEDYFDYSLLFEIRNDKTISYKPTTDDENCMFSDATLFHAGDTFTLPDYGNQFVEKTTLDNGKEFPWKITIENITTTEGGYKAVINLEQL